MRVKITVAILAVAVLSGCATTQGSGANYTPLIDTKGVDLNQVSADTAECQAYAAKVMSASDGAIAGAIAGALFSAVLTAAAGGGSRNHAAGVGALLGGVKGASEAEGGQRAIISRCMAGRGYRVLN